MALSISKKAPRVRLESDLPEISPNQVGHLGDREVKNITYMYSKAGNWFVRGIKWLLETIRLFNLGSYLTASSTLPAATSSFSTPEANFSTARLKGFNCSKLSINMGGRTSVGYTLRKKTQPNQKWLMVSLGNGEKAEATLSAKYYYDLAHELGIDNIAFLNYCGVGHSTGRASKNNGVEDVKALHEFVVKEGAKEIYHLAFSTGGGHAAESYSDGKKPAAKTVLIQRHTYRKLSDVAEDIAGSVGKGFIQLSDWDLDSRHNNKYVPTLIIQKGLVSSPCEIDLNNAKNAHRVPIEKAKAQDIPKLLRSFNQSKRDLDSILDWRDNFSSRVKKINDKENKTEKDINLKKTYEQRITECDLEIEKQRSILEEKQEKIPTLNIIQHDNVISSKASLAQSILTNRENTPLHPVKILAVSENHGGGMSESTINCTARIAKQLMETLN